MKLILLVFLMVILVSSMLVVDIINFGDVQATVTVPSVISSGTTWTKANSPYTLSGPIRINTDVTLTIEPGVTVDLNGHYIQVNGTLHAVGSSDDKITFSNGDIYFMQTSNSWIESLGSGSIIKNAIFSPYSIDISHTSPKIENNIIAGTIICSASSSQIINNTITGSIQTTSSDGSTLISQNIIYGTIYSKSGTITNNIVIGKQTGERFMSGNFVGIDSGDDMLVSGNIVYGCDVGITGYHSVVENNLVFNCYCGMAYCDGITEKNTVFNNSIGVYHSNLYHYNNIFDNQINAYSEKESYQTFDATNNWWGTVDSSAISQAIYDTKNDFNLGTINYSPFLTAPNSEAPDPNTTIPTPINTSSPLPTPDTSIFQFDSNSTITSLAFDSAKSELSFTVSGISGTTGFTKVTIAKSFLHSVDNLEVYLDGSLIDHQVSSTDDSWLVTFSYPHSTHEVRISLSTGGSPFLWVSLAGWIIAIVLVVAVLIVLIAVVRKKSKSKKAETA